MSEPVSNTDELKPCPTCGKTDQVEAFCMCHNENCPGDGSVCKSDLLAVVCHDCKVQAYLPAWQSRPIEDALNARILELELRCKIHDEYISVLEDQTTITDGFGGRWPKYCDRCGSPMQVIRPGDCRCSRECYTWGDGETSPVRNETQILLDKIAELEAQLERLQAIERMAIEQSEYVQQNWLSPLEAAGLRKRIAELVATASDILLAKSDTIDELRSMLDKRQAQIAALEIIIRQLYAELGHTDGEATELLDGVR